MPPGKRKVPGPPRGVDLPDINRPYKKPYKGLPSLNEILRQARKGQPGLDNINADGERHTAGQPKYAPTNIPTLSGNNSGGGGSLGGGSSGLGSVGIPAPDPLATGNANIDAIYAKLIASLKGSNTDTAALHDDARKAIEADFGASAKTMYDTYAGSRGAIDKSASGLGIDLATSKIGQEWDANLRKISDQSNVNKDTNLAWVEKMKALRGTQFNQLEAEAVTTQASKKADLALQLYNEMLAQASGGSGGSGGSGKRSGGGSGNSSSGSVTARATDTETVTNVGDIEALASLNNYPEAQALFDRHYKAGGGDVTKAITSLQGIIDAAAAKTKTKKKKKSFISPFINATNNVNRIGAPKNYNAAVAAQAALLKISGLYGNSSGKQVVSNSSSENK